MQRAMERAPGCAGGSRAHACRAGDVSRSDAGQPQSDERAAARVPQPPSPLETAPTPASDNCLLVVWQDQKTRDEQFDLAHDSATGGAISCATGTSASQFANAFTACAAPPSLSWMSAAAARSGDVSASDNFMVLCGVGVGVGWRPTHVSRVVWRTWRRPTSGCARGPAAARRVMGWSCIGATSGWRGACRSDARRHRARW